MTFTIYSSTALAVPETEPPRPAAMLVAYVTEHMQHGSMTVSVSFGAVQRDNWRESTSRYDLPDGTKIDEAIYDVGMGGHVWDYEPVRLIACDHVECTAHRANLYKLRRILKLVERLERVRDKQTAADGDYSPAAAVATIAKAIGCAGIIYRPYLEPRSAHEYTPIAKARAHLAERFAALAEREARRMGKSTMARGD